tara:strand:- start:2876 stop:4054 length:1179 start_codon:yes stop_codon:yes gene_type:complete
LLFQILDNKQECYKIFCNGRLVDDYSLDDLTHTWAPIDFLPKENIQYAKIWCGGKTLDDVCPEHLRLRWTSVNDKARVFLKTFHAAKIDLQDVCFYDLVPDSFLTEFYDLKNDITNFVFENYEKPKNYEFIKDLFFFLKELETNELNINLGNIDFSKQKIRTGITKIKNVNNKVIYNPWGTVTGRLTTKKNSFPILTLNKELRNAIHPQNDLFVELDFNSAELRVLLGLLNKEQPKDDMHAWINKNIFKDKYTRDQTKKKVFAWLYNPKATHKGLNQHLDRDKILEEYFIQGRLMTPYNRVINTEKDKAVNYLIQSTSSDMLLTSAMKINDMLRSKKSFVSFCIHDSVVIDMSREDKDMLQDLLSEFSKTKFGDIKANISLGQDFGRMRKVL